MSEKDVWRWIVSKLSNETMHTIYNVCKIRCSGFRTSALKDIRANRNILTLTLLQHQNILKLKLWLRDKIPNVLNEQDVLQKEQRELVSLAANIGAFPVLLQLLFEEKKEEAIQLYLALQQDNIDVLRIPDESICVLKMDLKEQKTLPVIEPVEKERRVKKQTELKKEENVPSKKDEKRLQTLEKKVERLKMDLVKQAGTYKKKMEEIHTKLTQAEETIKTQNTHYTLVLQEKEKQYELLLQEKERIENKYNRDILDWKEEEKKLKEQLELLQIEVELSRIEKEEYKEEKKKEKLHVHEIAGCIETGSLTTNEDTHILVIGKPVSTVLL